MGTYGLLRGTLELNIEKMVQGDGAATCDLFVRWFGNFQLGVQAGESLIIRVDSEEFRFTVPASQICQDFECDRGCWYDERAHYRADPAIIRRIAAAKSVSVEVIGSKRRVEREFNELNFERFREFVDHNIPAAS